jgi:hypothetical protein
VRMEYKLRYKRARLAQIEYKAIKQLIKMLESEERVNVHRGSLNDPR